MRDVQGAAVVCTVVGGRIFGQQERARRAAESLSNELLPQDLYLESVAPHRPDVAQGIARHERECNVARDRREVVLGEAGGVPRIEGVEGGEGYVTLHTRAR